MPITNALRKLVRSLSEVRHRRGNNLFVAEGDKCVCDTARHFSCRHLFAREPWLAQHAALLPAFGNAEIHSASLADMERMTHLSTPPQVIAVYAIPEPIPLDADMIAHLSGRLVVALDRIQDPGNLGTIMRLCDWMGVDTILASHDTVDIWSPKTVQATMGAISRVKVIYCDLPKVLDRWPSPVYGTFLDAPSVYSADLGANGVVVFGNEGRGISPEVSAAVSRRLFIPSFPPERPTSESLNVSTAAAIILSQFRSRQLHSRN